jgi:hypothetical protein
MIDKEELKKLCMKYDKKAGEYPESEFQGYALYEFFLEQSGELKPIDYDNIEAEITIEKYRETEENYLKELRK